RRAVWPETLDGLHASWAWVDVAHLDPLLSGTAWVGREDHLDWHPGLRPKCAEQHVDRTWQRIVAGFLNRRVAQVLALVLLHIGHVVERSETNAATVRHQELLALLAP